jgi:maleate cis-trans isomerase
MNFETRTRAKIGVLVPFTNVNLEPDLELMRPPDCTLHFHRMGGYDVDEIPGSDQMAGLGASDISEDLRLLSGVRPDVILYGCTSATLSHGLEFDRDLAAKITEGSGAISLTAAGSLMTAIQSLGVKKVGFSSPYVGEINTQAVDFLAENRVNTVNIADIGRTLGNYGQGELAPDEVYDLALKADHPDAEAIVLSCTDMRSVEALPDIEKELDKPVVTSNQAMMFCLMQALKIERHNALPGRLFDLL